MDTTQHSEVDTLRAKLQYMVDTYCAEEGGIKFPDGDIMWTTLAHIKNCERTDQMIVSMYRAAAEDYRTLLRKYIKSVKMHTSLTWIPDHQWLEMGTGETYYTAQELSELLSLRDSL